MARKLCTKEGCEDQSISRGLCPKHYQALRRREKDPLVGTRQRGRAPLDKSCAIAGCDSESYARGLCVTHYRRALRKVRRRTFAEKVLALWDQYDLDAEALGWGVNPDTEEIQFEVWSPTGGTKLLTQERFDELVSALGAGTAYEEWSKTAA
jgi:hypothetical protein